MQLSLDLDEYVIFDLETTGLSPWGGDEIIEIGALKVWGQNSEDSQTFHSLVNPKRLIPPDATRVNGITNEMVAAAPTIEQVFPRFLEFIGNSWLVAQNARFDMSFVMKYLMQFRIKRQLEVYDTMLFSRRAFPGESKHNLDAICGRLGFEILPEERHRSIGDVKLTAKAFFALKDKLGNNLPNRDKYSV
jgi:DNA polymerase III subunit epsilon